MPAPTGPTNPALRKLIADARSRGHKEGNSFLLKLATELARPERSRREVNLSKLQRLCTDGDIAVVPGKVLAGGAGLLKKKLTVAAVSIVPAAAKAIAAAGGSCLTIAKLIESNPKGSGVKIIC